ncbi:MULTISPECIES: carbohydrate ABC transporter permease [Paenibacillus]|jgi:multiple sugar transport system permease protein|uniref:Binding-protein-dependent transport systems inner membrane component n=2 Tax=Paenibacillus lactis TaxID=228574 RepID=G4HI67_9BACL|nr:sugar ABC transporter permease [Paenibacillus lactis]EHB63040.1 binding-protein-dependent transport systems inner membrane component [Paenibacillus lactis 154]MBP1894767.1 multiple sugar transport system permease protein [Paenibacillus lactis]MCM3495847.1 sugar ABC transporter permease [Paenibacillus lactis]GIO92802.1 spermidine/putrescine ABC transporter permease [Paenibacillus lactis]HAG00232.1 sugar ABC transporter permease [Paenibacillus lactis]
MDRLKLHSGIKSRERKRLFIGLMFLSPWIFGFLVFQLYPIIMSLYYSFTEYNMFNPPQWIGLDNYNEMFRDDKMFSSLYNTVFMALFGFFPQLVYALVIALLLNQSVKGLSLYRTVYFLPTLVPAVAGSLLWIWLLNAQYGLVNQMLGAIGLPEPNWLMDENWTKPSLILMGFWGTGTITIMYLAALQEVPKMYYEAASIDGANKWHKFWHITLPAISPMTFFQLIMGLIGSFQYFSQGYVFADSSSQAIGGPGNSILFYAIYLFQNAFMYLKMGYASAMAWILFIIVLLLTLLIFKSSSKWVFYGGEK